MNRGAPAEPERRPLATRERGWARAASRWLAAGGISPNTISVSGMFAGLLAGAALVATDIVPRWESVAWVAAAAFVQLRLLANMLDGMVAMETGRTSPVGELFNEIPDRVSDVAILVGLGYAAGGRPELGWALALAAVFTAYVRAEGRVAGAPQDYSGPFAKPHRMFLVTLVALYCGLAPETWRPVRPGDPLPGVPAWAALILLLGTAGTAVRRLVRIARVLRR